MKKPVFITILLITTIVVLSVVQIIVSNSLSTSGTQLSRFQSEVQNYNIQNYVLKEKLFTLTSYTSIASVAAKAGFVSQKKIVTLSKSLPIAVKR